MNVARAMPIVVALAACNGADGLPWPVGDGRTSYPLVHRYGQLVDLGQMHLGIDIEAGAGERVFAVESGRVLRVAQYETAGSRVLVGCSERTEQAIGYMHLDPSTLQVHVGHEVRAGDLLGTVMKWQRKHPDHLHFTVEASTRTNTPWGVSLRNPLALLAPNDDDCPPHFDEASQDGCLRFRSAETKELLRPGELRGAVDVIVTVKDEDRHRHRSLSPYRIALEILPLCANTESQVWHIVLDGDFGADKSNTNEIARLYDTNQDLFSFVLTNGTADPDEPDGGVIFSAAGRPWDTSRCEKGEYVVRARAWDLAGLVAERSMRVTVVH